MSIVPNKLASLLTRSTRTCRGVPSAAHGGVFCLIFTLTNNTPTAVFPPGFEPGTFRVLGERDDHYTTETS